MRVEITKEQYEQMKGIVPVSTEVRYFVEPAKVETKPMFEDEPVKPERVKGELSKPTTMIEMGDPNVWLTVKQRMALVEAELILSGSKMRRDELGFKIQHKMRANKGMGAYYVSELVVRGALKVAS